MATALIGDDFRQAAAFLEKRVGRRE